MSQYNIFFECIQMWCHFRFWWPSSGLDKVDVSLNWATHKIGNVTHTFQSSYVGQTLAQSVYLICFWLTWPCCDLTCGPDVANRNKPLPSAITLHGTCTPWKWCDVCVSQICPVCGLGRKKTLIRDRKRLLAFKQNHKHIVSEIIDHQVLRVTKNNDEF